MAEAIPETEKPDAVKPGASVKDPTAPGWFAETKEFVKAILWAFAIAVFLRSFVVEAYKIPSGSMLPTLSIGDHIFVNKFVYGLMIPGTTKKLAMWRSPQRGEIIVFKFPEDPQKDYIKRVIGVPGDQIDLKEDVLFVNGQSQPREYVEDMEVVDQGCSTQRARLYEETLDTGVKHAVIQSSRGTETTERPYVVPPGRMFVMGDNRNNSADSRTGFTVPYSYVKGRAMFVWLSWDPCGEWWPFTKIRTERFGEGVR